MGLADLHIHTIYSYDGTASLPAILTRARCIGLKALELASKYGVEVIPGSEVNTADGHLLALNVTRKIQRDQPLIESILEVGDLGGFCIAPHPMAGGLGMRSLSAYSILKALRNYEVAQMLLAVETYNATTIDKVSNHYAHILADRLNIAQTGSSDAHVVEAIGHGATEFDGCTAQDLLAALRKRETHPRKQKEWNSVRILGSWAAKYIGSAFTHLANPA